MARTIQDAVDNSGENVGNDDLVNLGSCRRAVIDPCTGPRSYWFRFGDIGKYTLPQIQAAIGDIASAGQPGAAKVMRISMEPSDSFISRGDTNFFGLEEFSIDEPVMVRCSVGVG